MGGCALITPVYLEIALMSGARSGTKATGQVISAIDIADISIRTLREEGDSCLAAGSRKVQNFYPRPPRGGRQKQPPATFSHFGISIHALREEGDKTGKHEWS